MCPKHTVQQFINQNKIILHSLFIKRPKVPLAQYSQPVQELEHQSRISIALRNSHQVDILMLDMAESCRAQRQYRRSDLRIGYDLYAKDISQSGAAIVAKGAEDQVLPFLVEDEDAGQHGGGRWRRGVEVL